jgi:2-polyprenyl-6-methoxyphenol hydroxylase-like FAD-dependent oxidoreductase
VTSVDTRVPGRVLHPTVPVAIVGGGPIGLALALFLDRHGVRSVVLNTDEDAHAHPRGNTHNARTMEHYRRLGISRQVRALGLPPDHPTDVAYFTRYSGFELTRLPMPSEAQKMAAAAHTPPTDQVPEPIHRANQMYVERFLLDHARSRPNLDIRFGWCVTKLDQDANGVALRAEHVRTGVAGVWRAAYAVGCDGGQSIVRRSLNVRYAGPGTLTQDILGRRATAAHLRLPTLHRDFFAGRRAWSYWAMNADLAMNLISLDGAAEFFLLTSSIGADRPTDNQLVRLVHAATGAAVPVEVLGHRTWTPGAALVADHFGLGRVFLAGDAAHLFTPTGGFGMNTGIDDVANLAWKLAAALQGWGAAGLPCTYELERRPVACRNTAAARELNRRLGAIDRPAALEEDSVDGVLARRRAGAVLSTYGEQFASLGVQLGSRYDGSPIIAADAGPDADPPADDPAVYTPTSVPGGRAPHLWLTGPDGTRLSLFDRFGIGFTLLRLGSGAPAGEELRRAARQRGLPLSVVDVTDPVARELYQRDLALIRPDQHVAWRGNRLPEYPDALLTRLTAAG